MNIKRAVGQTTQKPTPGRWPHNFDQITRATQGMQDYGSLFLRTMRYSLRRALSLDSVGGCTHNPKVGGSNPPPATNLKVLPLNHLKLSAGSLQYHNRLPLQAINPRKAELPCSDIILEKK